MWEPPKTGSFFVLTRSRRDNFDSNSTEGGGFTRLQPHGVGDVFSHDPFVLCRLPGVARNHQCLAKERGRQGALLYQGNEERSWDSSVAAVVLTAGAAGL